MLTGYSNYLAHARATCRPDRIWYYRERDLRGTWALFTMPSFARGKRLWPIPDKLGGVYAIYVEGSLVYIGSSRNIRKRLTAHLWVRPHWAAATVKVKAMRAGWRHREQKLIRKIRPALNRTWNPAR